MLTISYKNLHALLLNDFDADELAGAGVEVDEATIEAVKKLDIKQICVDFSMSENHLGGDNLVDCVDTVLAAQKEGYRIVTWYNGPDTDVLILGFRPADLDLHITLIDEPDGD